MALLWLVIGVVLLVAELRHFAFYSLFAAVGAFGAAVVAVFWPDQVALQLLVGVAVGGIGIWMVRPLVSTAFHRSGDGRLGRGVHGTLIGEEVTTLDAVGPGRTGHVRLAGESWLAISGSDSEIPAGTAVLVTAVQGTTLIVWPVDGYVVTSSEPPSIPRPLDPTEPSGSSGSAPSASPDPPDAAPREVLGPDAGESHPAADHHEGEQS